MGQGSHVLGPPGRPSLEESDVVSGFNPAAISRSFANSMVEGPSLLSEKHDLAFSAQAVEPSCLTPKQESPQLSVRVTITILEDKALSTRHLYTLKCSIFSDWCAARNKDLSSCDVSVMLTFLQVLLFKGGVPLPYSKYMWQPSWQIKLSWLTSQLAKSS